MLHSKDFSSLASPTPSVGEVGLAGCPSPLPQDFVWIGFASRQDLIPQLSRTTS